MGEAVWWGMGSGRVRGWLGMVGRGLVGQREERELADSNATLVCLESGIRPFLVRLH